MRRSKADKAITHAKIVAVAAKRFRERGLRGIGVADVMEEAGNSVGGFYKHFASRDDLVIEALAESFKDLDACESESETVADYMLQFMSERHRDRPETGCPITAFAGEVNHASTAVRTVYTQRVQHTLNYFGGRRGSKNDGARRARAILLLSAGIGGMSLARAVNDKALSREILSVLRQELSELARSQDPRKPTVKKAPRRRDRKAP